MSISRGYLNENYRVFHSIDRRDADFLTHSHDFHKVIFCLSGKITYTMEGAVYALRTGDILLVPRHQIHRSVMTAEETYDRIVLWISDGFLKRYGESALIHPFESDGERRKRLYRLDAPRRALLLDRLTALQQYAEANTPGHTLMADTYLIQFLLELNRDAEPSAPEIDVIRPDPRFQQLLEHINANLSEDLSVSSLAAAFYFSPSHLMHTFKRYMGCTVHRYITEKRLLYAAQLIMSGEHIAAAAEHAGFYEYSTFLKAFHSFFGVSPAVWRANPLGHSKETLP